MSPAAAKTAALRALAEDFATGIKLDGMFTLHPNLQTVGALYRGRQALFAHAVASPYRDRSHFDGQNVLETGAAGAYQLRDGWLNRLLGYPALAIWYPYTLYREAHLAHHRDDDLTAHIAA